ncbi:MAG: ATP-binding protein [Phycisphaeraceae bacterium]|nr:ATP-binding protein [Phycisphaeraceae bacterium]
MAGSVDHSYVVVSRPEAVYPVQQEILRLSKDAGFCEEALFAIRLALDEACCNAIRHGNRNDPTKHVTIRFQLDDQAARISVMDEGAGFKPSVVPDPTRAENLVRPSGRGVMLIRRYMSRVRYSQGGRCITMVKFRDCPRPQSRK